uniref:LOW QUALITY PROTEIN: stress response protein NST1-like n=1 Tax=Bombus vancouverensis nearcticus TaxID=2705178 RepID=UPI001439CCFE|nr:LOW QUALITY PROTEIN: stress response protein NST1-like [Bombus vancouverensis nearcticus]
MEAVVEEIEKMERGFEAMIEEIKYIYIGKASGGAEERNERERRERETDREKGEWEWEKKELLGRIRRIGEDQDRAERERRRRNIVIKGVDWNEGSNEETVKEFINEKMRIGAEVEKAHMIKVGGGKNTIIVATMKSMEEKIRIMKEKSKWEKGVYMDDDLTKKERDGKQHIRRVARERMEQGEYVRTGYKKLTIENKRYRWNENGERLEEERKRGEGK